MDMPGTPLQPPLPSRPPGTRRVRLKASRPSLIDLRFRGDAWVVANGTRASVCLGDYSLSQLSVSPIDVPSLNRVLAQLRLGQARRNYLGRLRKLPAD